LHIWGNGGRCGNDDGVTDTPDSLTSYSGCPSYPQYSCKTSNMYMNYMDYVDDNCMFMFTLGQKLRTRALFEPGGYRDEFVTNNILTTSSTSTTTTTTTTTITPSNGCCQGIDNICSTYTSIVDCTWGNRKKNVNGMHHVD
jgi:hypothetical protein